MASPVTATRIAPRVCEYPFLDNSLLRELEGVVYRRETVSRRLGRRACVARGTGTVSTLSVTLRDVYARIANLWRVVSRVRFRRLLTSCTLVCAWLGEEARLSELKQLRS